MKMQCVEQKNQNTERELQWTKHQKKKKEQVSQNREEMSTRSIYTKITKALLKNKSKRDEQSPSIASKYYHDPDGISIRKGKELGHIPSFQYCKNGIPHNRWCVINTVQRKGKEYNVKERHIFHAKLALSEDNFELLLRLL